MPLSRLDLPALRPTACGDAVEVGELRRLHTADWMHEQGDSGARVLATMIRDGKGPMQMPGPNRSCFIGERLLAELEAAGPPDTLSDRVLATMRRAQWNVPDDFRDAGVFVSGDDDGHGRQTRFAVWLQVLVRAIGGDDWTALIARARPLAASPRK